MPIQKFKPSPALMPYIKEFLIIEVPEGMNSTTLPDANMIMSFRFAGGIQRMDLENPLILPSTMVAGLRKTSRQFQYARGTANLLVILHEGGIKAFSKIPAHELFGISVGTENFFRISQLEEVIDRLTEAVDNHQRIIIIETFLLQQLRNTSRDPLIQNAIQLIRQHNGILRIKELVTSLYISQDAFEKRFRAVVGSTPKQFASIIRLRELIKNYPSHHSLTAASYAAGYFDQAHFIKDFRLFTGQSPKDFFKNPQHW